MSIAPSAACFSAPASRARLRDDRTALQIVEIVIKQKIAITSDDDVETVLARSTVGAANGNSALVVHIEPAAPDDVVNRASRCGYRRKRQVTAAPIASKSPLNCIGNAQIASDDVLPSPAGIRNKDPR